jgi:TolA-binding protein
MVAAWLPPGANRPQPIPASAFGSDQVGRVSRSRLEHRTRRGYADFRLALLGECPLEQGYPWMVRAQLQDTTEAALGDAARYRWDFGDGQKSEERSPTHIYLHPGKYKVTLVARRGTRTLETANWVHVGRPRMVPGAESKQDELADYLPQLATYDPKTLDATGLVQLVRALVAGGDPAAAVEAGGVAFAPGSAYDDPSRWQLARMMGPLLRYRLDRPAAAGKLWQSASALLGRNQWRARCALEAADILLHDLLRDKDVQGLLNFAQQRLPDQAGSDASRLYRLRGDWHARQGNAQAARAAYQKAAELRRLGRNTAEQNAWRGARSRSVEAFLRDGQRDRARDELLQWQLDFPADKMEGYLSRLWAQYWVAEKKWARAIAVANDLLAVNPDSPYADQLLFVSASCEERLGRHDRAKAALESLLADYPGSPLVKTARERLARMN